MATTVKRFGFKNSEKSTGLAAVGEGTPNSNIFIGHPKLGVNVGYISHNNRHNSKRDGITIHLKYKIDPEIPVSMVGVACGFNWVILKFKPKTLEEAKVWLNSDDVRLSLMDKLYLS